MSKVTMPEPSAWMNSAGSCFPNTQGRLNEQWSGLITTDQAEAYADAKVREALEEAAIACETHPDGMNMLGGAFVTCATTIRALIK